MSASDGGTPTSGSEAEEPEGTMLSAPLDDLAQTLAARADAIRDAEPNVAGDVVLRLRDISKHYGAVCALSSVDLEVRRGEVHALVGENGAGKSTLVGVAAGAIIADDGVIEIAGETTSSPTAQWSRDRGLGIVHQEPALLPDLTVAENMRLGMPPRLRPSVAAQNEWATEKLAPWAASATIDPRTPVRELRPDERFVVEIAQALAKEPTVLILDEPTEHLLPEAVTVLFDAIRAEIEKGAAVIYISHRIREVKQIAHQVTVLRDGTSRGSYAVEELTEQGIVDLIVGRARGARYPTKPDRSSLGPTVLEVEGLSGPGFSNVAVSVQAGEIVGLAGIEGQGQRDFLRALAGLGISRGKVSVAGRKANLRSSATAARTGFSYVANDRHREGLLSSLTVRENLTISELASVSDFGFIRRSQERKVASRAIERFAIKTPSGETVVTSLSGGNQQKVMMGRSIMTKARVFLADEPTQGVDVGARADIYAALRDAADAGSCVLVLSSDAAELEGVCDRVLVFSRGQVEAILTGDEVTERNITQAVLTATAHRAREVAARGRSSLTGIVQSDLAPAGILILALCALGLVAAGHSDAYLTTRNFNLMLSQFAILAFIAFGQQLVMMVAGIDLSVGSLVGLITVLGSYVLIPRDTSLGVAEGTVILVVVSLGVGLLNWFMVAKARITPLVATLVTYIGLNGVALIIRSTPGGEFSNGVLDFVSLQLNWFPLSAALAIVVALALELGLRRTLWGTRLRATGSSAATAAKVGIRGARVTVFAYVGCSLFTFVGAMLLLPQAGSGNASIGEPYTLQSVSAVALGGASLFGGRGSFIGALLGAGLLVQINTVTQFLGLNEYWQQFILGGLTIVAVALYSKARTASTALEATA